MSSARVVEYGFFKDQFEKAVKDKYPFLDFAVEEGLPAWIHGSTCCWFRWRIGTIWSSFMHQGMSSLWGDVGKHPPIRLGEPTLERLLEIFEFQLKSIEVPKDQLATPLCGDVVRPRIGQTADAELIGDKHIDGIQHFGPESDPRVFVAPFPGITDRYATWQSFQAHQAAIQPITTNDVAQAAELANKVSQPAQERTEEPKEAEDMLNQSNAIKDNLNAVSYKLLADFIFGRLDEDGSVQKNKLRAELSEILEASKQKHKDIDFSVIDTDDILFQWWNKVNTNAINSRNRSPMIYVNRETREMFLNRDRSVKLGVLSAEIIEQMLKYWTTQHNKFLNACSMLPRIRRIVNSSPYSGVVVNATIDNEISWSAPCGIARRAVLKNGQYVVCCADFTGGISIGRVGDPKIIAKEIVQLIAYDFNLVVMHNVNSFTAGTVLQLTAFNIVGNTFSWITKAFSGSAPIEEECTIAAAVDSILDWKKDATKILDGLKQAAEDAKSVVKFNVDVEDGNIKIYPYAEYNDGRSLEPTIIGRVYTSDGFKVTLDVSGNIDKPQANFWVDHRRDDFVGEASSLLKVAATNRLVEATNKQLRDLTIVYMPNEDEFHVSSSESETGVFKLKARSIATLQDAALKCEDELKEQDFIHQRLTEKFLAETRTTAIVKNRLPVSFVINTEKFLAEIRATAIVKNRLPVSFVISSVTDTSLSWSVGADIQKTMTLLPSLSKIFEMPHASFTQYVVQFAADIASETWQAIREAVFKQMQEGDIQIQKLCQHHRPDDGVTEIEWTVKDCGSGRYLLLNGLLCSYDGVALADYSVNGLATRIRRDAAMIRENVFAKEIFPAVKELFKDQTLPAGELLLGGSYLKYRFEHESGELGGTLTTIVSVAPMYVGTVGRPGVITHQIVDKVWNYFTHLVISAVPQQIRKECSVVYRNGKVYWYLPEIDPASIGGPVVFKDGKWTLESDKKVCGESSAQLADHITKKVLAKLQSL